MRGNKRMSTEATIRQPELAGAFHMDSLVSIVDSITRPNSPPVRSASAENECRPSLRPLALSFESDLQSQLVEFFRAQVLPVPRGADPGIAIHLSQR